MHYLDGEDFFADYSIDILEYSSEKLDEGMDFVSGLRDYMKTGDDSSIDENREIIAPYTDHNGAELEYKGHISIYKKR